MAFDPSTISGLGVWLDASQLALADNAQVSVWPNLGSGTQTVMVDSLPLARFKANVTNSKGVVRFSASGSRLRGNATSGMNFELLYITRRWGAGVGRAFSAVYPPTNILVGYHSAQQDVVYDNGWKGLQTPWGDTGSVGEWKLYGFNCTPGAISQFFNMGILLDTWGSATGLGNGDYCLNGLESQFGGFSETMDCDVAEMLIYSRKLSDSERVSVENYLHDKWFGVAAAAPKVFMPMSSFIVQ